MRALFFYEVPDFRVKFCHFISFLTPPILGKPLQEGKSFGICIAPLYLDY